MKLPSEVAVMTLPNAWLFPQALLPLYIFEPRYRKMLATALAGERMFAVAMKKSRQTKKSVAGLGLIRAAVKHADGTSHLILQGLIRVELGDVVRSRPYRIQQIHALQSPPCDVAAVDALVVQVRDLLAKRFQLGLPFPFPVFSQSKTGPSKATPPSLPAKEILNYLDNLATPDQVADLVSCAVLSGASERQKILETVNVEARLSHLVRFLTADIRRQNQTKS